MARFNRHLSSASATSACPPPRSSPTTASMCSAWTSTPSRWTASIAANRTSSSPTSTCCCARWCRQGKLHAAREPAPPTHSFSRCRRPFRRGTPAGPLLYRGGQARDIAPHLARSNLVILESTSPIGTSEQLSVWLAAHRPDLTFPHQAGELSDIRIAHCPERVLPGQILAEVVENARIIGGLTRKCAQSASALYRIFVKGEIHLTTPHRRDGEADRERLSRRQHRLRQ